MISRSGRHPRVGSAPAGRGSTLLSTIFMKSFMKLYRRWPSHSQLQICNISKAPPRKVAIAQVRFAPVHAVEKRGRVADFQERLAPGYVARDPQVAQAITIQFGPSPPPAASSVLAPELVWPFEDHERGWSVSLSSSSLALEASAYDDFDGLLEEFRAVVTALVETFAPRAVESPEITGGLAKDQRRATRCDCGSISLLRARNTGTCSPPHVLDRGHDRRGDPGMGSGADTIQGVTRAWLG